METAGNYLEDEEAREAMKDVGMTLQLVTSVRVNLDMLVGLGTPATRAAIIEKLLKTGYAKRIGRSLIPTKRGIQLVALLREVRGKK
jgi:DNA topoisomerase-3